jgi:hypothetical protein
MSADEETGSLRRYTPPPPHFAIIIYVTQQLATRTRTHAHLRQAQQPGVKRLTAGCVIRTQRSMASVVKQSGINQRRRCPPAPLPAEVMDMYYSRRATTSASLSDSRFLRSAQFAREPSTRVATLCTDWAELQTDCMAG